METLKKLIDEYLLYACQLRSSANPVKSALGMRDAEVRDRGHDAFYQNVAAWTEDFLRAGPEEAAVVEALDVLLFAAAENRDTPAEWYLLAVQAHAKPLIAVLSQARKAELGDKFKKAYPRGKRLPLQNELLTMLGTSAKGKWRK